MIDQDMVCVELVEWITEYLDDALSAADRARFERHLAGCVDCTGYLDQMRKTIQLSGRLRESDIEPQARAALLRVFEEWQTAEI
jgi:anti-sigma factor RsiW